jgi:uridine kinase
MSSSYKSLVVGIAGGTASGKSTLCRMICESMPTLTATLRHDDYYRDNSHLSENERARINFDSLEAIETELFVEHLSHLRNHETVESPKYDFASHARTHETRQVSVALDLSLFVDLDDDLRFIRRLQRDRQERGRDVESIVSQYQETVKPFHDRVVEASKEFADLIVQTQQFERIVSAIESLVQLQYKA